MSVSSYSSRDIVQDLAVVSLGLIMCALAFLQYVYNPQDYRGIVSLLYYLGVVLKIVVVIGSFFILFRLRYPQSAVAGILLVGFWLLPEFFPDSPLVLFLKKVNDIFGFFGGVFLYPIWRWQSLTNIKSSKGEASDDEPTSLNLKD